jgi:hypothetical protein
MPDLACQSNSIVSTGEKLTSELPFRTIQTPQTHTEFGLGHADLLVNVDQTGSQVFPPLLDRRVVLPCVVSEGLRFGIVWAQTQALVARDEVG